MLESLKTGVEKIGKQKKNLECSGQACVRRAPFFQHGGVKILRSPLLQKGVKLNLSNWFNCGVLQREFVWHVCDENLETLDN